MVSPLWKRALIKLALFYAVCFFLAWVGVGFIVGFVGMSMGTPNALAYEEVTNE